MRDTTTTNAQPPAELKDVPLFDALHTILQVLPAVLFVALAVACLLQVFNVRGTAAIAAVPFGYMWMVFDVSTGASLAIGGVLGGVIRECWRLGDIKKGHDKRRRGKEAVGLVDLWRIVRDRRRLARGEWGSKGSYPLGIDRTGAVTQLPLGLREGIHSLIVGATGFGKTTTMLTAAQAHLDAGMGVVFVDAKGDGEMTDRLRTLALVHERPCFVFSLDGYSQRWNPLAHGNPSERADKLIAAEEWTEPHYQRLYQRYLLMVFAAFDAHGDQPSLARVVDVLHPDRLALYARDIEDTDEADRIAGYLADLTNDERRDLAGLRNRLALLVEGQGGDLLEPDDSDPADELDLLKAITQRAVVVFSLNTSRYPETAKLLGAAVLRDLQTVAGHLQAHPDQRQPTFVLVDEFGAFGQDHIVGLFQRARSVQMSLMLGTQELSDLARIDPAFERQVIGNCGVFIAHMQNVPESAERIAEIAGTDEVWIHTFQTDQLTNAPDLKPATQGTKRRGHEFKVAPDTLKNQQPGEAVVIHKPTFGVRQTKVIEPRLVDPPVWDFYDHMAELDLRTLATNPTD